MDVLAGELSALATVVVRLIETITPEQAAHAHEALLIDRDAIRIGTSAGGPELELATTERALDNYLSLLIDVAES